MVTLVDENDQMTGTMEKSAVHRLGKLHRAISVFIFNSNGHMLLQQRALHKYHSGGKWSNACCSHPKPGESVMDAAKRRLREEIGLTCDLHKGFEFTYHAVLDNNLVEHEYDHVFFGFSDERPSLNTDEVESYDYLPMEIISDLITQESEKFTEWFKICFDQVSEHYYHTK